MRLTCENLVTAIDSVNLGSDLIPSLSGTLLCDQKCVKKKLKAQPKAAKQLKSDLKAASFSQKSCNSTESELHSSTKFVQNAGHLEAHPKQPHLLKISKTASESSCFQSKI